MRAYHSALCPSILRLREALNVKKYPSRFASKPAKAKAAPDLVTVPASAASLALIAQGYAAAAYVERLAITEAAHVDGVSVSGYLLDRDGQRWVLRASYEALQEKHKP
jgi:hypothetical protein